MSRVEWMDEAACREVGVDVFFPETKGKESRDAIQICRECPVINQCLEYALTLRTAGKWRLSGIWGGTDEAQRREIMKMRRKEKPLDHTSALSA